MKEKISALMDGEDGDRERAALLAALRDPGEARSAWSTYHLIGDAMRDTRMLSPGFAARVAARIAGEPTLVAPRARPRMIEMRPALSLAAGLAAFAFVVAAVFVTQFDPAQAPQVVQAVVRQAEPPKEMAQVQPPDAAHDYLLAHQVSSPRNSLQGMAPYVRMVSGPVVRAKP